MSEDYGEAIAQKIWAYRHPVLAVGLVAITITLLVLGIDLATTDVDLQQADETDLQQADESVVDPYEGVPWYLVGSMPVLLISLGIVCIIAVVQGIRRWRGGYAE